MTRAGAIDLLGTIRALSGDADVRGCLCSSGQRSTEVMLAVWTAPDGPDMRVWASERDWLDWIGAPVEAS